MVLKQDYGGNKKLLVDYYDKKTANWIAKKTKESRLFRFYFNNIVVLGIDQLKKYIFENPNTVIMHDSNHYSLMDFIGVSYILHMESFEDNRIPRTLAGSNLYVWPVSCLWDVMGGLRYYRNGDKNYKKQVLKELTDFLVNGQDLLIYTMDGRGENIEVNPTFLHPLMNAYFVEGKKDIAVVPIYVGYDTRIEGESVNVSKKLKKIFGKLGQISDVWMFLRKFLFDGPIGNAYFSFGKPIHLNDVNKGTKAHTRKGLTKIIKHEIEQMREETLKYKGARTFHSSYSSSAILKIS